MITWHKMSEKPPKVGEWYVCWAEDGTLDKVYFDSHGWIRSKYFYPITHWTEINAPEEKE